MMSNFGLQCLKKLGILLIVIVGIVIPKQVLLAQSCNGADGLFPPLSGNTVIANGDICANSAITPYRWEVTYTNVEDGGNPGNVEFFIDWNDGFTQTINLGVGDDFVQNTGPNAYRAIITHFFPITGADVMCEYIPTVSLQVNGIPCASTIQNPAPVVRWNTDNENTGTLQLSEQNTSQVIYEICAGNTETIRFYDRSEFNCVPPNFPGFPPNARTRWFQFIYGGDPVQNTMTSATGITINSNTGSNPESAGNITLTTNATFSSAVVMRPQPIDAPTEYTFDITVPADAQAGQEFAITLNNWNNCNPYESGGFPTGNLPVQTNAIIRIIDSPPAPAYTPLSFCVNQPININVTPFSGGLLNWYAEATLINNVFSGNNFDPVNNPPVAFRVNNATPGIYTYYVTETLGNNCEGPAAEVSFEIFADVTAATAGPNQVICTATSVLSGNEPIVGTGLWSVVSGPGTLNNASIFNSTVSNLNTTTPTVFRWTITNGSCVSFDEITISRDKVPDPADAGIDQFECNIAGATLSANDPINGTGWWTQTGGPAGATITSPSAFNSQVTGLVGGNTYTFRWT
ncbi:MAG: hypothetical protein OEX02_11370, partial [Cyclobacteriaceae bacterium]|nr:hypothetical protein [Cyclobacteriaceae bacterium]